MNPILLVMTTATYRARAFVDAAARSGIPIVVGSDREPALGSLWPERFLGLDFDDVAKSVRRVEAFASAWPIAGVVAAEDDGVVLAAAIARRLGLRHAAPVAVARARDKRLMREALQRAGVPSPWFLSASADEDAAELAHEVEYPCVLKPPALSMSRGVLRANTPAEFAEAFPRVVQIMRDAGIGDPEVLVEGYVPGAEVAVEGLLTDGRLRVLAVFDKPDEMAGPTFEETLYVTPTRLDAETCRRVEAVTSDMCRALGLDHGPVHAELRVNDGGIWPIEIAPRSIGGLCSLALRFRGGVSLEQLLLRHAAGEDVGDWEREPAASGVLMIPIPRGGILHAVHGVEAAREVPGVDEVRVTIPMGHAIVPLPEGHRYLGFIFARAERAAGAESALREAHGRLSFDIHTE